jgi:cytochrome c-type biogenesis protein
MQAHSSTFSALSLVSKIQRWRWGLLLIGGALLVSLVFALRLTSGEAASITTPAIANQIVIDLTADEVAKYLLRSGAGPNDTELDILYAPTWYYQWNQRTLPQIDQTVMAFFVMETIHDGDLVSEPPVPILKIGDRQIEALETQLISDAPHHRVSQVLYPALDEGGQPLVTEKSEKFTLVAPINGVVSSSNTFKWELPLPGGLGLVKGPEQLEVTAVGGNRALSWPALLAIMGGMLTALSPCLLQLGAYYAAVLAGAGSKPGQVRRARKHLINTAIFFAGGFTLIYTAGGFVAGHIGGSLQQLAVVQQWSRPISIVAGIVIILLAVRVAVQAKAPLICKLPLRNNGGNKSGKIGSAVMGASFAIGCLSCFSATVLSALLMYAGSTGSPITGAMLLFLFSSGVGLVFLLAAWLVGEATPLMGWLERAQPVVGGISALIMVGFGMLMVTYQFHVVSGFLFRLFSIG